MSTVQFAIGCVIAIAGLVSLLLLFVIALCWVAERDDETVDELHARRVRRLRQERATASALRPHTGWVDASPRRIVLAPAFEKTARRRSHGPGPTNDR